MAEHIYKPGETVPKSGLYVVVHQQHRDHHEATLFEAEQFPTCAQCGAEVRFQLMRAAIPIHDDSDFVPRKARGHSRGHR